MVVRCKLVGVGTKERCEPEDAHSLHVGPELTRSDRIDIQLTPPTVYADTVWAVYI